MGRVLEGLYDSTGRTLHEGYLTAQDADGAEHELWSDEDAIVSWQAACSCGWVGTPVPVQPGERLDDARYDELVDISWNAEHARPLLARKACTDALTEVRQARAKLDGAVREALALGNDWTEVARMLGVPEQEARRRFEVT